MSLSKLPKGQRLVVCGGRDFGGANRDYLFGVLDKLAPKAIAEGGAPGADCMAKNWAIQRGVIVASFYADWDTHGKAAGPIRNREMLQAFKPDRVIAFPGGAGTADMIKQAMQHGVPVSRFDPNCGTLDLHEGKELS